MTEGPGFLEFFILEASDYVEQLDGLLLGGSSAGPDADALQRVARALRGTATMAKLSGFAEVAAGVERVGRAMQEGVLRWDPALGGAMVATIDDLKTLLHAARTWSAAEDERASSRTEELARFAPPRPFTPTREQGSQRGAIAGSAFLATEAANIAAGLELLSTRAGASDTAANLLRRIRALRGVAGVKSVAPLADVLEVTEDIARGLEFGERPLNADARHLLETAAEYLRVISAALRFDGDFNASSAARDAFVAAQTRWMNQEAEQERVVPISALFYADDGPQVVEASQNPPTSTADRFRLELVSHGEHLRQVIDAVRQRDATTSPRVRRDLHRALSDLQAAADSFGERDIGDFLRTHMPAAERADASALAALDELASVLSAPGAQGEHLAARIRELAAHRETPEPERAAERERTPEPEPTREPEPTPEAERAPASPFAAMTPMTPMTPPMAVASASAALIDLSLAALDSLASVPWIEQAEIPEETIVPIESLLYRGTAALDRAIEIRDEIRDEIRRTDLPRDSDALEELFDLLELARAE
jgi:chemotaxis protein histidine kinase CheA